MRFDTIQTTLAKADLIITVTRKFHYPKDDKIMRNVMPKSPNSFPTQ